MLFYFLFSSIKQTKKFLHKVFQYFPSSIVRVYDLISYLEISREMQFRWFLLVLFLRLNHVVFGQIHETANVNIAVDGIRVSSEVDRNYICATVDWWPHDKCDYNQCPWAYASAMNLNLSHPLLAKAIQAFKPLRIRIGGSLQDRVLYDFESMKLPCHPFQKMGDGLFGFTRGCLHMSRWDELNLFFRKTGAVLTFGLNALYGRHQVSRRSTVWGGDWDSSNAYEFIKYTVSKRYEIDSWEYGNELSGSGVGARVGAKQYAKDLIKLRKLIDEIYAKSKTKPSIVAPGGFYEKLWFTKLLQSTGSSVVNVVTHHLYNLGPGNDPSLVSKILSPHYLNKTATTFIDIEKTVKQYGNGASLWVGESGGAYNSGGRNVSDTFVDSFWYLDQLGMAAKYNSKVYCRQSLIGGNYGLLDKTTFVPNPDYYSALLWHRLMGTRVLSIETDASPFLRTYAHCSKGRPGITLLLINLSNQTEFIISAKSRSSNVHVIHRRGSFVRGVKQMVPWVRNKSSDGSLLREEYLLSPAGGSLRSKTMLLNGIPLDVTINGEIPILEAASMDANSPITITSRTVKFVVLPNFNAPACL